MTHNDSQKALLLHYAVREVGPQGSVEQMKVVCYCLRNRVRAGWGEWMDAVEAADAVGSHATTTEKLMAQSRSYQTMLQAIDDIFYAQPPATENWDGKKIDLDAQGDTIESAVGTGKYWRFLNRPLRPWFLENVVNQKAEHAERMNMGLMVVYR